MEMVKTERVGQNTLSKVKRTKKVKSHNQVSVKQNKERICAWSDDKKKQQKKPPVNKIMNHA